MPKRRSSGEFFTHIIRAARRLASWSIGSDLPGTASVDRWRSAPMPRILVIDEYSVFREGLCSLIESNIPAAEALPARGLADFFFFF